MKKKKASCQQLSIRAARSAEFERGVNVNRD